MRTKTSSATSINDPSRARYSLLNIAVSVGNEDTLGSNCTYQKSLPMKGTRAIAHNIKVLPANNTSKAMRSREAVVRTLKSTCAVPNVHGSPMPINQRHCSRPVPGA